MHNNNLTVFEVEYDDTNISVILHKDRFYVPIKPIIQHIGLDLRAQSRMLNDEFFCTYFKIDCIYIEDIRPDDSINDMRCISLATLDNFFEKIDITYAPKWVRDKLEHYKASCTRTLMESLNSRNLDGVVSITTSNDPYFLDLVAKQCWSIRALQDLGVYVDLSAHLSLD